jgi:hypothetical protein
MNEFERQDLLASQPMPLRDETLVPPRFPPDLIRRARWSLGCREPMAVLSRLLNPSRPVGPILAGPVVAAVARLRPCNLAQQ